MRIAVAATGSDGDVLPFVALAQKLRELGHDAWLVVPDEYRRFANDVPLRPNGTPARKVAVHGPLPLAAMKNPLDRMKLRASDLAEGMFPTIEPVLEATSGAELIVHHHMDLVAFAAAERRRIRRWCGWVAGIPWVGLCPSRGLPQRLLYRAYDAAYWRLQYALAEPYLNRVLVAAKLASRRGVLADVWNTDVLLAISRWVTSPHRRLPERTRQTGFWYRAEASFQPDVQLSSFLESGERPVVATFGSTALGHPVAWSERLVEGILQSGKRGILVGGHAEIGNVRLPDDVLRCDWVPFGWLFSRASAVIHHGGAGTTALAFRAGVPQAVAWQISDQPRWGAAVHRLGVGARPVAPAAFSAEWVRRAISTCTEDPKIAATARSLAERVRAEDGLAGAARLIEEARA